MESSEANYPGNEALNTSYRCVLKHARKWLAGIVITCILIQNASAQFGNNNPFLFTTIAGSPTNEYVDVNGTGGLAGFDVPEGIVWSTNGNLYVADFYGNTIRQVTPVGTNWQVSTIAGNGAAGVTFTEPAALAVDGSNNLYVLDDQSLVRKLTQVGGNWVCTTIAGTGTAGNDIDGTNTVAQFNDPSGVAADAAGNVYVADTFNNVIRKLTPVGTNWVVTTIAGTNNPASPGSSVDGTNQMAQFFQPWGIAVDSNGNLFVTDVGSGVIREITPVVTPIITNWVVTTIAGTPGNLTIADGTNGAAAFDSPYGIAVDTNDTLYIADSTYNAIRKITPIGTNWVTTTLGGGSPNGDFADGVGTNAFFNDPSGITLDNTGNIYIADALNFAIRKGTNAALPSLTINVTGSSSVLITWPGSLGTLQTNSDLTAGSWGIFAGTVNSSNGTNTVTMPVVNANLYFRLTE